MSAGHRYGFSAFLTLLLSCSLFLRDASAAPMVPQKLRAVVQLDGSILVSWQYRSSKRKVYFEVVSTRKNTQGSNSLESQVFKVQGTTRLIDVFSSETQRYRIRACFKKRSCSPFTSTVRIQESAASLRPPRTATPTRTPSPTPTSAPTVVPTSTPTPLPTPTSISVATPMPSTALTECSDGIDNDGDGLTDMADNGGAAGIFLGCQGPNWSETGTPNGYTMMLPSADTRIIYVSDTFGDDTNSGFFPRAASGSWYDSNSGINRPHGPVKTVPEGAKRIWLHSRDNPGVPDWLLMDRCDDFRDQMIGGWTQYPNGQIEGSWNESMSGRSGSEPKVISSFGTCVRRPRILTSRADSALYIHNNAGFIVVSGIEFYPYRRDPENPAFSPSAPNGAPTIMYGAHDIIFEDNKLSFYALMAIDSGCPANTSTPDPYDFLCPPNVVRNITLRRNVIVDGYSTGSHSQGIFSANVRDLVIEGNVFDHNGWSEHPLLRLSAEATIYNHNMYLAHGYQGETIVRGNIVANGSATGIQARVRGVIEDNLVMRNPLGITLGHEQITASVLSTGVIRRNVVIDARDIDNAPRGFGIATGRADGVEISDNIVTAQRHGTHDIWGITVGADSGLPTRNVLVTRNIVYDWNDAGLGNGTAFRAFGLLNNVQIIQNDFQQSVGRLGGWVSNVEGAAGLSFVGNRYFSSGALHFGTAQYQAVFKVGGAPASFSQFASAIGESGGGYSDVCYMDPGRGVEQYMTVIGHVPDYDEFIREARQLFRGSFRAEYTADAANRYIRAGFAPCP